MKKKVLKSIFFFHFLEKKFTALMSYIILAIRYLEGGHSTGFNHITTNAGAEKRMFQVKGNKNIRVKQVHNLYLILK